MRINQILIPGQTFHLDRDGRFGSLQKGQNTNISFSGVNNIILNKTENNTNQFLNNIVDALICDQFLRDKKVFDM